MYEWHFQLVWLYRWVFLRGAWITAELTFLSIVFGTAIGVVLGLGSDRTHFFEPVHS
jgi:polar amino acid transport system permease protein